MTARLFYRRVAITGACAIASLTAIQHQSKKANDLISRLPVLFQDASSDALRDVTTPSLINGYFVYFACSNSFITSTFIKLYELTDRVPLLNLVSRYCARKTFYAQFCGGESELEASKKVESLQNQGIGTILVYECEDKADINVPEDQRETQCERIIEKTFRGFNSSIVAAASTPHNMVAIKISSLVDVRVLHELNNAVERLLEGPNRMTVVSGRPLVEITHLTNPHDEQKIVRLCDMLDNLAKAAQENGVALVIDAEETWFQRAIDLMALQLQKKYNREHPVVWTTLQMYLKRATNDLEQIIAMSKGNFKLAVKLVRGAYMASEKRELFHNTLEETHKAYDNAVERIVSVPDTFVLVATHNHQSVLSSLEILNSGKFDNGRMCFGQLYGMNDDITFALKTSGARVYKYVPYVHILIY